MKKFIMFAMLVIMSFLFTGCALEADTASRNLSTSADQFEVFRRIVFYNGITDGYIFVVEGFCSLGNNDTALRMSVTCKTGENQYKKHYLGLSDNVSFFAEQIDSANVDPYHHRIVFRPTTIIPDIEVDLP